MRACSPRLWARQTRTQGTSCAVRLTGHTNEGAKIHESLIELAGTALGQVTGCDRPQEVQPRSGCDRQADAAQTREDPPNISIQRDKITAERDRSDGCGNVLPHTRQIAENLVDRRVCALSSPGQRCGRPGGGYERGRSSPGPPKAQGHCAQARRPVRAATGNASSSAGSMEWRSRLESAAA